MTQLQRHAAPEPRRLLGAFYTPDDVAKTMVRWALEQNPGSVLDPSFGGCAFLRAGVEVLRELGLGSEHVVGVDIDSGCKEHASGLVPDANIVIADFLGLTPAQLPRAPFAAIVGNPPFVRHHWVGAGTRPHTEAIRRERALSGRSSTWAYFVVHALQFLAPDGRLAIIVPEAILQTDYAEGVRDRLRQRFATTRLISVRSRLFSGTDETAVVITGEGRGPGTIEAFRVGTSGDLASFLAGAASAPNDVPASALLAAITVQLNSRSALFSLGQLGRIRIGTVTGANKHFIVTERERVEWGLEPEDVQLVLSRARALAGATICRREIEQAIARGAAAQLVVASDITPSTERWIRAGEAADVHQRYKCSIRKPWFSVQPVAPPDLFSTCSRLAAPRLVQNKDRVTCTNALHCVYLDDRWKPRAPAIVVGFLSSLTAVAAELHGRRYGGGVLKIEPTTLGRLPLVVPQQGDLLPLVDDLLRSGQEDEARAVVDQAVLIDELGIDAADVHALREVARQLAAGRPPPP